MTPPQHICPKCKLPYPESSFLNEKGKPAKWCYYCRAAYRERLTHLHAKTATKPRRGEEAIDATSVAKQEGYQDHPLAALLALSHIAGAKRALAIRDGNSWRGKKAWRAYYEAKRALAERLKPQEPTVTLTLPAIPADHEWFVYRGNPEGRLIKDEALSKTINDAIKRDPNSSGVS